MTEETEFIARQAFAEISTRFPTLTIVENTDDPVEISLTIPVQKGIRYKIWLALQNDDELHFSVSNFWLEWFPCTNQQRVGEFLEAVLGFISGEFRIVEYSRRGNCFKAELLAPTDDSWKCVGTGSRAFGLPFGKVTQTEVSNA